MKKTLKEKRQELYYYEDGIKKVGNNGNLGGEIWRIWGNFSNIKGYVSSALYGDVSNLTGRLSYSLSGDISNLSGNITGFYGIATGLSGNLDECELTDDDREKGINIRHLINRETNE